MAWLDLVDQRHLHRLGERLLGEAHQIRDVAADRLGKLRHRAAATAENTAHQALDIAQHQAGQLAGELTRQATRTGRALRRDPVPVLVAAFGAVMLFNLMSGRRRR